MKKLSYKNAILFLLFALPISLFAQGTISGKIIEKESGEEVMFANVYLKSDTNTGTQSDLDGKYQIQVAAGTYTVVASYVGYDNKELPNIEVKDGEVTYLDIVFSSEEGGVKLDEIVIVEKVIKTGENAILISKLNSDRFTDGISSQEMKSLNISDASQAVSKQVGISVKNGSVIVRGLGDRYSTAQLNGASIPSANPYKNAVNLDLIPAGLLSNIITSKTFTPDQPGTFTGGNVNMETKNFPEQRKFSVTLSTGFNTQSSFQNKFLTHEGGSTDWLGYDDGTRALASQFTDETYADALKKSAATKARNNDELANQMEEISNLVNTQMTPTEMTTPMNHGIGLSYADQYSLGGGKLLGLIFAGNYNRKFTHYNGGLRNYNLLSTTSTTLNQNFNLNGTTSVESPTVGGMLGLSLKLNPKNIISFNSLYNHSADKSSRFYAGEHNTYQLLNPEVFEFRELYWIERNLLNNMLIGEHSIGMNGAKIEWIASASEASQDEPELRYFGNGFDAGDTDSAEDDSYSLNAPAEYDYPNHFFRNLKDSQYEGKVDVTLPILTEKLGKGNKVKFGGLYSKKDRTFDEKRYSVQERDATAYVGDDIHFGDANSGILGEDANGRNIIGNYIVDDTRTSNSYTGSEEILAAYAMTTIKPISKLKIIGGARFESTKLPVTSADSTNVAERSALLPALSFVYEIQERMNLRGAFSQTIARPNLRELAPFSNYDFRTGAFITGNTQLEITSITNLDLRWEWLKKPGELFAVSGYYKSFENPIVLVNLGKSNPEFQFQNVPDAIVYGVEFEFRKDLGFISPKLNNFKWSSNFSYIHSEVDINEEELSRLREINPNASDKRTFFNQSPYLINSNLTYSQPETGIDAGLSFSVFGKRMVIVGQEGTPDIFETPRPQLDFTISKKFSDNMSLRLSAQNLLDPEYRLESTFLDTDYIFSNYKLGRTFSTSFSYTF